MTHADMIAALGGVEPLASALSVPIVRVRRWHERNRIPADYWPDLASMARNRRIAGVTFHALAMTNPSRKRASA